MDTISPSTLIGVSAPAKATHKPTKMVDRYGVRKRV